MDCKELDRISRSGFSKIFEDEVRSVLKDIDLGIDEAPNCIQSQSVYVRSHVKVRVYAVCFYRVPGFRSCRIDKRCTFRGWACH
mgnify:CR=1 FL=1